MHQSVIHFVHQVVQAHGLANRSTLEVGSLDVNGSVRPLFAGPYVGVDMRDGPRVDEVVNAHDLVARFGTSAFEVVVCCEMLEHDEAFWVSMRQMGDVLAPGGHMIVTTRGIGFGLHEYPSDYWRFTKEAGLVLAKLAGLVNVSVTDDQQAPGIFIHGSKP